MAQPTQPTRTPEEEDLAALHEDLVATLAPILLYARAHAVTSDAPVTLPPAGPTGQTLQAAVDAAMLAFLIALIASLERHGSLSSQAASELQRKAEQHPARTRLADTATDRVANRVAELARTAPEPAPTRTAPTRTADADADADAGPAPTREQLEAWADNAATSLATETASQAARDVTQLLAETSQDVLEPPVQPQSQPDPKPEQSPFEREIEALELIDPNVAWKKIWISRGDHKVRKLHRSLHGEPALTTKPFWTWPLTGEKLNFPGDPDAPLSQTINCRCLLFYVPAAAENSDEEIHNTFKPADLDDSFDTEETSLVASPTRPLTDSASDA